ncbi:MAG: NTP transferase domain-containing protein [Myxococcota bacterium]
MSLSADPVDGFVLAGGRSRRMGSDKARAPYRGRPLGVAAAESLRQVCGRVDDGLPWPLPDGSALEVVLEPDDEEPHPLWGVVSALDAARTERVAIVPCDVPGVTAWDVLLARAPSVAWDGERLHPLVAVVTRAERARAAALARAGAPARVWVEGFTRVELSPESLTDHDDPASLGIGPIARLTATIPVHEPHRLERIVEGERARLAALGMVDPDRRV